MQQQVNNTNKIFTILKWAFGIIFLLSVVSGIQLKSPLSALAFLFAGLLLLPPTSNFLKSKFSFLNNSVINGGVIFIFIITAFIATPKKNHVPELRKVEPQKEIVEQKKEVVDEQKTKPQEEKVTDKTSNTISGITPVDVYGNFEKIGYSTDKKISTDGSFFYSDFSENGIEYHVTTYCENGVNNVNSIDLQAMRTYPQYNKVEDMKPYLKYGCSIPYDGADIGKVNNFIDANYYHNKANIVISGVKFTIYCPTKFARTIEIEKE